ncbi:MAG: lytic transglycosylase [Saccharospirillum sp.]
MTLMRPTLPLICASVLLGGCSTLDLARNDAADTDAEQIVEEAIIDSSTPEAQAEQTAMSDAWLLRQGQPVATTEPPPYDPYAQYPDDLYQVMRKGFRFDLELQNSRIDAQINWYSRHQSYFDRVSERASRYMFHIVNELEARDMPLDLAMLPIVESAFDPFAYSHGSAAGMWQFIPSTGRMFDLKQDWWFDGRRDVIESTRAALDYLQSLNRMFDGDWELALAAYNSGPGTVMRAIRRNESAGLPTDYWSLQLPRETMNYVPKMYALASIIHSPEHYDITLPYLSTEPFFDIVDVGGQIDLAQAAELADMNLSDLYLLNPGFNQWATDPDGPHRLLVFADKAEGFRERLVDLPPDARMTWQRYTIVPGDSLSTIAQRFNVTMDMIRQANELNGSIIRAGDALMIPTASARESDYSLSASQRLERRQSTAGGENRNRIDYQVKSGDTFWDIARAHDVSVQNLARWNNMAPGDVLRPGQTLAIWVEGAERRTVVNDREVVRRVGYTVRRGDSLYRIANRFNVRIADIERWNSIDQKYLQPGQTLTLYVDVTRVQ